MGPQNVFLAFLYLLQITNQSLSHFWCVCSALMLGLAISTEAKLTKLKRLDSSILTNVWIFQYDSFSKQLVTWICLYLTKNRRNRNTIHFQCSKNKHCLDICLTVGFHFQLIKPFNIMKVPINRRMTQCLCDSFRLYSIHQATKTGNYNTTQI